MLEPDNIEPVLEVVDMVELTYAELEALGIRVDVPDLVELTLLGFARLGLDCVRPALEVVVMVELALLEVKAGLDMPGDAELIPLELGGL